MSTTTAGIRRPLGALAIGFATLSGCASGGGEQQGAAAIASPAPDSAAMEAMNGKIHTAVGADDAQEYRIGSNDLVRVDVFGAEAFSGDFRVDPSGTIAIPLLGAVPVAGHTARELEDDLEGRLRETYMRDPNVTVRVDEMLSQAGFVYVVGEVNRPGGFEVPPGEPMTVLQALAMAGGLGGTAAASRSVIVREERDGTREEVPVDLDDVLHARETPPMLGAGDVLFVPKNGARSFALGAINALVRMVTLRGLIY